MAGESPGLELDRGVPALVARIGHYPLHHGAVGAIRSLGRAGVPVYTIAEDRFTPAAVSRWLAGRFVWPNDGATPEELLDGFARIGERIGGRPVLLATDDETAIFVAEHADQLRPWFRFPEQRAELPRSVASKLELARTCAELGVATPRVVVPADRDELLAFCAEATFPVVVKAVEAWVLVRAGIRSTTIATTPEQLIALWDQAAGRGQGGVLLQEFIPDGEDWILHGYCDERSEAVAAYSGVKVRSFPASAGPTTLGRCRRNDDLLDQAQILFRKLGYRGIMDMDWRLDRRDGRYKLLDFNPRLGAQFRLFVDERGLDVARAMHLDLTGRDVPAGQPPDGRAFLVEHADLIAALGGYRRAGLTVTGWWRSLAGVAELAWFDPGDPLPAASLGVRFSTRVAGKALRKLAPRPERPRR